MMDGAKRTSWLFGTKAKDKKGKGRNPFEALCELLNPENSHRIQLRSFLLPFKGGINFPPICLNNNYFIRFINGLKNQGERWEHETHIYPKSSRSARLLGAGSSAALFLTYINISLTVVESNNKLSLTPSPRIHETTRSYITANLRANHHSHHLHVYGFHLVVRSI